MTEKVALLKPVIYICSAYPNGVKEKGDIGPNETQNSYQIL